MLTLNEIITFEHENEHDLEHDLVHKKDFSAPKIYSTNGDLSKTLVCLFFLSGSYNRQVKKINSLLWECQ